METTLLVLNAVAHPGEISRPALQAGAEHLLPDCQRIEKEADRLLRAVAAAQKELGSGGGELRQAAEELKTTASTLAPKAVAVRDQLTATLGEAGVQESFPFLAGDRLPTEKGQTDEPLRALQEEFRSLNPAIPEGLQEIAERKAEWKMSATLDHLTREQLEQAIDRAETRAATVDRLGSQTGAAYQRLDRLLAQEQKWMQGLRRASQRVQRAQGDIPSDPAPALAEVHRALSAVAQSDGQLQADVHDAARDFKAALLGFTVRRYEREARLNQVIAGLYELLVRKVGQEAERHQQRSRNFFYAMLIAQASVTIATISLALRRKSLLWILATVAGLGALAMGIFVYLKM